MAFAYVFRDAGVTWMLTIFFPSLALYENHSLADHLNSIAPVFPQYSTGKSQTLINSNPLPISAVPAELIMKTGKNQRVLTALILHSCLNPKWVLNAARQSYCNSWSYSLSLDKYKPLTPPFDSTFTQKIESVRRDFSTRAAPTFIHLPPSVPIQSAFPSIIRVELSTLLCSSGTWLQNDFPLFLIYHLFSPSLLDRSYQDKKHSFIFFQS